MGTRTGNFSIGFRRGGGEWQKNLASQAAWAKSAGFDAIDLMDANAADIKTLRDAGLKLGTVDLRGFWNLVHADAGQRKENVANAVAYVKEGAALGAKLFFTVIRPFDASKSAGENFKVAVEAYAPVCHAAAAAGGFVVLEGWPANGENLACNPESYRATIKEIGKGVAVNFDPSHLIRMGIDPLRFVAEFAPHVKHVHGKDTMLYPDAAYELGLYQNSIGSRKEHGFGSHVWRYTIPGHGVFNWVDGFSILKSAGFSGVVSVELEDENFNGSDDGEKAGLIHSLNFLRSA